MADTLVKRQNDAPERFFEAEAAGLAWLAEAEALGGARIVGVHAVAPGRIELERVIEVGANRAAARDFGAALARTHEAGAPAFGAPPTGWDGPLFIGRRPMDAAHDSSWGAFYARTRVLPFLELAVEAGSVRADEEDAVRAACALLVAGEFDDGAPPSRIHGDLWNGNVLWSSEGAVLIDPAAHGGHRETDLAMLALFGAPYLGDIVAGYDEVAPLASGWRSRLCLHQLHPLAVHAASYGRSYGQELGAAARATLALRA